MESASSLTPSIRFLVSSMQPATLDLPLFVTGTLEMTKILDTAKASGNKTAGHRYWRAHVHTRAHELLIQSALYTK